MKLIGILFVVMFASIVCGGCSRVESSNKDRRPSRLLVIKRGESSYSMCVEFDKKFSAGYRWFLLADDIVVTRTSEPIVGRSGDAKIGLVWSTDRANGGVWLDGMKIDPYRTGRLGCLVSKKGVQEIQIKGADIADLCKKESAIVENEIEIMFVDPPSGNERK